MKNLWEKIKSIFKKADDLREIIENKIAKVLDKASESELLDKGASLILNATIEAIESYVTSKTGQNVNIPDNAKKQIVDGVINGNNKLQKKIAEQLRE